MNRKVVLRKRPAGVAQASDFEILEVDLEPLQSGEVRLANRFLSVDPAMRGWIADKNNYSPPVAIGEVMRSLAVGDVIESKSDEWQIGDTLLGWFGWQEFAVASRDTILTRFDSTSLSPSLALGILGINGVTALLALTKIGDPTPGDTLVVSTAAGAVGSAVGQIGKLLGCRTVGITGSSKKVELCRAQFGYDHAFDYKTSDISAEIRGFCPDGVDIYFDNTAGAISDAVFPHLAIGSRIVCCGTAAIDRWDPWPTGPRIERYLLTRRARMQGFVVFDHMDEWQEAIDALEKWIRDGRISFVEDVLEGIHSCPDAIAGLYRGENNGKRIIRLNPNP